jgi:hypothetical protein
MPIQHNESFHELFGTMFSTTSEKIGGVVAGAMISSPLWIQEIKPYSDIAALLAPILGCIYLVLQITFKLWDRTRKED